MTYSEFKKILRKKGIGVHTVNQFKVDNGETINVEMYRNHRDSSFYMVHVKPNNTFELYRHVDANSIDTIINDIYPSNKSNIG